MDLQYSWVYTACFSVTPQSDLIFLSHMERTYIGVVQRRINFEFSWKLKKWEFFEKCKIS